MQPQGVVSPKDPQGSKEAQGSLTAQLTSVIEPLIASQGYELVLLEHIPRAKIVRLYIDKIAGNGVTLDDCSIVSRLIGDTMDAEGLSDKIDGQYTLEVSSPGLDRPLVKFQDFERFVGREVSLSTREPYENRRRFLGKLKTAQEQEITLEVDGRVYTIAYANIDKARLVPKF